MQRTYEGMFLLDPTKATQEWESSKKQVIAMLERRGATILSAKKWADRKLAYEIKGHKRGTYLLIYFKMESKNIAVLRRDLNLTELVLRNMILAHDKHFSIPEAENTDQEAKKTEPSEKQDQEPQTEDGEEVVEEEASEEEETEES